MNTHGARLLHLGVLRIAGSDAIGFLQGQLSNDTRRLNAAEPIFAAFSNAQGRAIAIMHLLPHSTGVIAILPRELLATTRQRLSKFVLRAKVEFQDLSELWSVSGCFGAQALQNASIITPGPGPTYVQTSAIGAAPVHGDTSRFWVVGPEHDLRASGFYDESSPSGAHFGQRWRLADVRAGIPQVYTATSEMFVPQMLNLDLLDAISFTKGCYTGQEIIARTQHLGRIKRRMSHVSLPRAQQQPGDALQMEDGRSGRLVETVELADHVEALAVLNTRAGTESEEL